ncbi:MAG: deoxyribodipyrimidine photo-lyase, partial [Hydrogenobacter sp.]
MLVLEERLKKLNGASENLSGKYVLYCIEASQREEFNHALEFAVMMANHYKKPLVVAFFITDRYKFSNARYYRFMLEGILKTKKQVTQRGIKFLIKKKTFVEGCIELSKSAVLVVCDKNYLRTQRRWREKLANLLDIPVYVVESDVVVPISLVSDKSIPYAFMYRKKLEGLLENFLKPVERIDPLVRSDHMDLEGLNAENVDDLLNLLQIDKSVSTVERFYEGGTDQAKRRLRDFIENKLPHYKEKRNDPAYEMTSDLSP